MSTAKKLSGIALATAAAGFFAVAPMTGSVAYAGSDKIHCVGVNACKGTSDCKTANNACKGQNACKGAGFVALTEKQCEQVGGKVGE